jgi:uncharacterized NAD(P)/FAD-binding protein YdhS
MNPLKIEVTEAMRDEYFKVFYDPSHDSNDDALIAALTAAFQHPEFVRQIREQVFACVSVDQTASDLADEHTKTAVLWFNAANQHTSASLGRLLGEER